MLSLFMKIISPEYIVTQVPGTQDLVQVTQPFLKIGGQTKGF